MADAARARGQATKPARGGHPRRVKAPTSARNQQPSSPVPVAAGSTATILPRIDRRGVDATATKNEAMIAVRPISSPQERDLASASIPTPTPPRRPSIKAADVSNVESSPTYHDDEDGPSAKAAWCTPRSPTPTGVDWPHLTGFFSSSGESDAGGSASDFLATSTRLRSVEETLAATEALYEVDLNRLQADNDKFFEISTSALQHVEVMQSELPSLADSFQDTKSALSDLCGDIATLHHQHEEAQQRMMEQMASAVDANADEMVALTEAHAADKAQLTEKHLQEMQDTCVSFETTIGALEQKLRDTEASYKEQLERLRETSDSQLRELQASTKARLAIAKETAQAELDALEKLSSLRLATLETSSREQLERREKELQEQLEELQSTSSAAFEELRATSTADYKQLKDRSDSELAELQHSSQEELKRIRLTLTSEIETLKRESAAKISSLKSESAAEISALKSESAAEIFALKSGSAAEISALKSKSAQELQTVRRQKEEELSEVRSTLRAECERILRDSIEEKARLNKLREEQLEQLEERRARETHTLSSELEGAQARHMKEVADLHAQHKLRIATMETTYTTDTAETKASHVAQMNDVVHKAEVNLSETVSRYEDQLRCISDKHDAEMKRSTQQNALDCESLVTKYEHQASEAEEDRRREREALVLGYETELESLKRSTREQLLSSTKAHEAYVSQLRESHAAKVLSLETSLREQETQFTDQLASRTLELETSEDRARVLEARLEALHIDFRHFSERSSEALTRKDMDIAEQEALVLRLDEELHKTHRLLEESQRKLKFAEDDRQVKAGTILELTFVIKSRDEEVDKLRNSLLDTVKAVNTKSEILEMTTETLSFKAKELEDTRAALRIESGRLTMVEESMHQKEGMLEDTTLKVESMRLNMESMRLEMKRMQMDMKLQLEHTEGEMELKNGEIRRLHSAVSELKLKNDFSQHTIERLEESLGTSNRQIDEAQRRVNLLKLEASNRADELKKSADLLCDKENALLVVSQEKQALSNEKNRLQIQLSNLLLLSQRLREEVERNAMYADDTLARHRDVLEKTITEKDERLRAEKHLLKLELNSSKDMVCYLEVVEERYKFALTDVETLKSQRMTLELELSAVQDCVNRLEGELQVCQLKNREQSAEIRELNDTAEASETRFAAHLEAERRHVSDLETEMEGANEKLQQALASTQQLEREKKHLQDEIARATRDHEFLLASINEEKTGIFETISILKKNLGDREEELLQVRSERVKLQEVAERMQSELDQALDKLKRTQEELANRDEELATRSDELDSHKADLTSHSEECGRLSKYIQELEATCNETSEMRSQESAMHAEACRKFEADISTKANDLAAKTQELAECLEQTRLLQEDHLGAIRGVMEKAEGAIHALGLELQRVEEEKIAVLLQIQESNADTIRRLEEDKDRALQCVLAEKDETTRLAEEEKSELLRLAKEDALAILRQAEEEKNEILLERQLRESATRNHRAQERERLRRLAKYEQERLMELNESGQMLAEEQQTRLLAELYRTKDENANMVVEHCLSEAAAKLQLVQEQEELRKMAHDERIRLLELNEASRMVAEEQRVRLLDKEMKRQRLMDEEQTARLLEQHAREQMTKEEEYTTLLERHKLDQVAIAQQQERLREQHERFFIWNAEHETRLFESHLADVEALEDSHALEQAKLVGELADVKRILDERLAKAEADKREWERSHTSALLTTAQRHQVELDTSIQTVREEENRKLHEKHKAEIDALMKEFEHKAEVIRLQTAQEHLFKINEMLEKSRLEEQERAEAIDSIKQELEARKAELVEANKLLEEQKRTMNEMELTLNAKRLDTEAQLNANLLELEVHRDAAQQELEIELRVTEIALAEANEVVVTKSAAIESLRKELAIVLETSESTRSAEQLVSLLRQQIETYLLEEHRVNFAELSDVRLDGEHDVLECLRGYFGMRCRPHQGTFQDSTPPILVTAEHVRLRLDEYDRICALLLGKLPPDGDTPSAASGKIPEAIESLQHNMALLCSNIRELLAGSSDSNGSHDDEDVATLVGQIRPIRDFFDKLQLQTPNELERLSRQARVVEVVAQHERLMQAISTCSERDVVHSVDDLCAHLDKLEKMLTRARQATESEEFRCLADIERILDECELHRRQVAEFKLGGFGGNAEANDSIEDKQTAAPSLSTNLFGAADVASLLHEFETFVADCQNALELDEHRSDGTLSSTVDILEGIHNLMSILHHFEALQPQLGSPRRRDGDDIEMMSPQENPSLRNKVAAIVAFADELKSMSEFAQDILDEECDMGNPCEVSSNMSSASLASLRSLTRTPTPSSGLVVSSVPEPLLGSSEYLVDDLELSIAVGASGNSDLIQRDGYDDGKEAIPALSVSPSAFMADSLLDISLVMSDHQKLLAETAHLVGKASRQTDGTSQRFDVGAEISRLVREHCALLGLTRRLFKVKDARHDLPYLLECVAILQRFTQRLPLLGLQPSVSSENSNNSSCASLSSIPQSSTWGYDLAHNSSSTSSFAGNNSDTDATGASNSTATFTASEQAVRSSMSIFATIEEVARHLQDYDYLIQYLKKKHVAELPSAAFTSAEALSSTLSENVSSMALMQQFLGLENAVADVPQVAVAVHDIMKHTQHLVLQQNLSSANHSALDADLIASEGLEAILCRFEAIVATLAEFSGLLMWLQQTILQIPASDTVETSDNAPQPVNRFDMTTISDLKQHVRDFVSQLCDLQTANHELEQEVGAMQNAQQQMLHELRNESDMLSRLDTNAVEPNLTEESSPQRRRADVLETLLAKQEAFRRQSSFQNREQQREIAFLRDQGLLSGDGSDADSNTDEEGKIGVSSTTRLAIYKRLIGERHSLERQIGQLKHDLTDIISRHAAETQEFHRQAELVRQHDRNAADQQMATLNQKLEAEIEKLKQTQAQLDAAKQDQERRVNELMQSHNDTETRMKQEQELRISEMIQTHNDMEAQLRQELETRVSELTQHHSATEAQLKQELETRVSELTLHHNDAEVQLKQELETRVSELTLHHSDAEAQLRQELETRVSELTLHHNDAEVQLKQELELRISELTQHHRDTEAQLRQELDTRTSELTQHQYVNEPRLVDEKNVLETQVLALEQALSDAQSSAAAEISTLQHELSDAKASAALKICTLEKTLSSAKESAAAEINTLEQVHQDTKATYEKKLSNWKHLAQAALDEEMAYLRRSDSLAFAASKLQCFSDGSISDIDEERGYSRLNVWKAITAHIDRLSDRLAAVDQRGADEYDFLRSSGLIDSSSTEDTAPLASVRPRLYQELIALRNREIELQRELEDEAVFMRSEVKVEFDELEPATSRRRVYKALLDGQSALIDDKMEWELEAARETAFLEANNLQFDTRMGTLEHLVRACDELKLVKKQLDEERNLLVEKRVCTPQELRRPLQTLDSNDAVSAEPPGNGEEDTPLSLGEFANIRLDVYRKLLANEQQARDELVQQRQEYETSLATALSELQSQHQAEIMSMVRTIEQLELGIMLREDVMSGLGDRFVKHQAIETARQRQDFNQEKQKDMAEALARWAEQSEAAIAAATATATANAAALVADTHKRELERRQRECDERIMGLSDAHAKQLALVSSVHSDSEAQAKHQVDETVSRQVAKVRAGLLERLAKRDGAAVATIYRCIRMATDVLNPSAYVTSSPSAGTEVNAAPPSRHGSTSTSNGGGSGEKIPVAVTHSVVALVKELKALKEHVATSLDQLQVDESDALDASPPLSVSSSFLLGGSANSDSDSTDTDDAEIAWTEGKDQVADAILCAYREIMLYASRQLLTRQQAADDALARLYTLVLSEEAAAASLSAESHTKAEEELKQQRGTRSPQLAFEIELTRERTARENAEFKQRLHDVCVRRLLEDQRAMEAALSKALEVSQLESKQLQARIEQLEHYQRLALTSSGGFHSSPNAARTVTPTRGFGGSSTSMAMPVRPERPRDHQAFSSKGGGTAHKERFVSDLEQETGQRRTTGNSNGLSLSTTSHGDVGGAIRRRRPFPAGEMDISSLSLSSEPQPVVRGSLHDQELWFQGVRTLHFVSFFVSVFYVPKQGVFRVEVLNSDTEQQQTVYVTRAEMQQFVSQYERDKRRRYGQTSSFGSDQGGEGSIDDPARRGDIVDALFDHVKVYGEGTGNMLLAFE